MTRPEGTYYADRATELCAEKESEKMKLLKEAAFNYGQCNGQLESAVACSMPDSLIAALDDNKYEAGINLEQAAIQYFKNVYDGAEE